MSWTKAIALLMCMAVLAAPAPVSTGLIAAMDPATEYAVREAQAGDLESFTGGWHGVVLTLILVGVVVWICYEIWHHEEAHHGGAQPETPPAPKP